MMELNRKIEILEDLGIFFKALTLPSEEARVNPSLQTHLAETKNNLILAQQQNQWFTMDAIVLALNSWSKALQRDEISTWLKNSNFSNKPKRVGVIMAGNIPLVGLHDALAVLVSGHQLNAKLSSKDTVMMGMALQTLGLLSPEWKEKIKLVQSLKEIDCLIATGTDNSSRYFDYYFSKVNRLIRKNRTSLAVLTGEETKEHLEGLAKDIFYYYGLGCRNVTKVYLPRNYDLDLLFNVFYPYKDWVNHNKYGNNYEYNKAVYLLNKIELIENGFLLMKEDEGLHSPIGVLFYEYYDELSQLEEKLTQFQEDIQCKLGLINKDYMPFGISQEPKLWDYADGINTLDFLNQ